MSVTPTTIRTVPGERDGRADPAGRSGRRRGLDAVVALAFLGIALAVYGASAINDGWYYDDWALYTLFHQTPGGFFADLAACGGVIPGSRGAACTYHAAVYDILGGHRTLYGFVAIGFLAIDATLLYLIARRCRLPRVWAAMMGALLIIFPADDATRLWPTGAIGQYVVALALSAILVAHAALASRGRRRIALHVASAALALFAMVTYEIAIPIVAVAGSTYFLARRDRAALVRWGLDLGLIAAFIVYRLVIVPVSASSGLNVHRDGSQMVERARVLLRGAYIVWRETYLPGRAGTIALLGLLALLVLAAARGAGRRRRLLPFVLSLMVGVVLVAAGALIFLPANDLYVPDTFSTFNRLNLPGSFGYAAVGIGLLGLVYELARWLGCPPPAAATIVGVLLVASTVHQLSASAQHQRAWEASWHDQRQALAGYRVALRDLPAHADVIGFDTPIWQDGFVPVFAAGWDLRGALSYETGVDPRVAFPLVPDIACGATGVMLGAATVVAYTEPVYFVSPKRRVAQRVTDQRLCAATVARFGRPPYWGSTVTGVPFTV